MSDQTRESRDYRFVAGLALGSLVGAGLTMLLAPRAAAEIKERAVGSAKNLGGAVSERYRDARSRVTGAVDGISRKGRWVRESVSDAVVRGAQEVERGAQKVERGAQEVERYATEAKAPKAL
jgi:gas vesicle protein